MVYLNTKTKRNTDSVDTYHNEFTYNAVNSILRKEQEHWIDHPSDGSISPRPKTTYDYAYEYNGRPHAPTHIGGRSYHYDLNGNMTSWVEDKTKRAMTLVWDEENRLAATEEQGKLTLYRYDDVGTPRPRPTAHAKATALLVMPCITAPYFIFFRGFV